MLLPPIELLAGFAVAVPLPMLPLLPAAPPGFVVGFIGTFGGVTAVSPAVLFPPIAGALELPLTEPPKVDETSPSSRCYRALIPHQLSPLFPLRQRSRRHHLQTPARKRTVRTP